MGFFLTWYIFELKKVFNWFFFNFGNVFFLNQNVLAWTELVCQQKVKTTKRQPRRPKGPRSNRNQSMMNEEAFLYFSVFRTRMSVALIQKLTSTKKRSALVPMTNILIRMSTKGLLGKAPKTIFNPSGDITVIVSPWVLSFF